MISPDSMTRKSCGERFDLIASDFVVLAETLLVKFLDFGMAKLAERPTAMPNPTPASVFALASFKQLIKEIRRSLPGRPGRLARFDYEHERNFCNTTELSNLSIKSLLFPPT